jgi:D-alanyl-D-alanine endopeptidase (penicillin-binding protein 7)
MFIQTKAMPRFYLKADMPGMQKKFFDFFSSFGLMILGVILLFVGTVSFTATPKECRYYFPKSNPRVVAAADAVPAVLPESKPAVPLAVNTSNYSATMTAFSAFVMDEKTNTVLFDENADDIRPLASISKLMSAIVLMDLPMKWTATTTVLEADCDNSDHHLAPGEIYTLDDLFSAALVGSSNSAVRVLTRVSGLPAEEFVARMNAKAGNLNLKSLKYFEPTGLDSDNVGSARDTAKLLKEALRFDKIAQALNTGECYLHPLNSEKTKQVWSTNWLLTKWIPNKFDAKDICGKTGFINDSRYNFVVRIADVDGHKIIVAIFGAATNETRFSEARDLAEWIFDKYLWPDEDGYANLVR